MLQLQSFPTNLKKRNTMTTTKETEMLQNCVAEKPKIEETELNGNQQDDSPPPVNLRRPSTQTPTFPTAIPKLTRHVLSPGYNSGGTNKKLPNERRG